MSKLRIFDIPSLNAAWNIVSNPEEYAGQDELRLQAYAALVKSRGGRFRPENIPQLMLRVTAPTAEQSDLARALERAQPAIKAAVRRLPNQGGDAA